MRSFLLLWVLLAVMCCARAPETEFEVASLRQSQTQIGKDSDSQVKFGAAGVTARNVTLKQLIQTAYGLQPHQVSGGPRWPDETEYDLEATAAGSASPVQLRAMLQSLLADRFHLAAHKE